MKKTKLVILKYRELIALLIVIQGFNPRVPLSYSPDAQKSIGAHYCQLVGVRAKIAFTISPLFFLKDFTAFALDTPD